MTTYCIQCFTVKMMKECHLKPVPARPGADYTAQGLSSCSPLVCSEWLMSVCAIVFRTVWQADLWTEALYVCAFWKKKHISLQISCHLRPRWPLPLPTRSCLYRPNKKKNPTKNNQPSLRQCTSPWLQMDRVHKALMGSGFALTSPLKRKASSCGVCQLRFSCEVGVYTFKCFSFFII